MTRAELPPAFHDALAEALKRHEAARKATPGQRRTPTPDDAAEAVSGALTARTIDRPRVRTTVLRLRLHRRDWPRVHEHAKRAHIRFTTARNREGDDPHWLVLEVNADAATALRSVFPDELEVIP